MSSDDLSLSSWAEHRDIKFITEEEEEEKQQIFTSEMLEQDIFGILLKKQLK